MPDYPPPKKKTFVQLLLSSEMITEEEWKECKRWKTEKDPQSIIFQPILPWPCSNDGCLYTRPINSQSKMKEGLTFPAELMVTGCF